VDHVSYDVVTEEDRLDPVMLSPGGQAVLKSKILSSASALASKIFPRPRTRSPTFVLGLSLNFLFWPLGNVSNAGIGNFDSQTNFITCLSSLSW